MKRGADNPLNRRKVTTMAKYLAKYFTQCPHCREVKTANIIDFDLNPEYGEMAITYKCDECKGKWVQFFKITDLGYGVI